MSGEVAFLVLVAFVLNNLVWSILLFNMTFKP